jgi:hypothetical protein
VRVRIYIEGGGDSRSLHIKCREGFRKLLEKAGFSGRMPATKACGNRRAAYDDFCTAVTVASPDEYPILLVDSESAVTLEPWSHLHDRDKWTRPPQMEDEQAQLMVQCMETWCVADRQAMRRVFGDKLIENALPSPQDLEDRSKDDVQEALANATRNCGREKKYRKGWRSFDLLAQLDPRELKRLPHFARLCDALDARL